MCIGGGGRREEGGGRWRNATCSLLCIIYNFFFYSFTVLRSRTRCLTTGVKLFNMYNTCKSRSRRGGYCFIKRAMPGRVRLHFLLAASQSFLSHTHTEVRPTDLKADAATNMSGFNLLINYSKCRYWTLNFTTFQTFFFFFSPEEENRNLYFGINLSWIARHRQSLHQRWCTDFTPTLSGSCFWRYLSPKNLVFIKHAGKSFYIWVSARWKEKKTLDLIGDEHDGNFVSLVFLGCKK